MLVQGTYYGQQSGQDDAGVCAYGKNFANTLGLEWSTGVQTLVAMNRDQYNNSKACGQCIMYRSAPDLLAPQCFYLRLCNCTSVTAHQQQCTSLATNLSVINRLALSTQVQLITLYLYILYSDGVCP